ncbi:hypothetical protein CXU12_01000 [Akkermansia muciniphila]|nr:hypothetical protein CXU12_01000 [Akkermansia muciniphila]
MKAKRLVITGAPVRISIESGEWRVESGEWRVESGEWRVESGEWRVGAQRKRRRRQKKRGPFRAGEAERPLKVKGGLGKPE